jgi:FlaA1/EpsC-like NDP-sugar epimerase
MHDVRDETVVVLSKAKEPRAGLRCLIVGAGDAGRTLARDFRRVPSFGLVPVGFLDDNPRKRRVGGLPILGATEDLTRIARAEAVDVVVLAIPSLPSDDFRRLAEAAAAAGVSVRYLPSFITAVERDARVSDLKRMRVDRLLGRQEMRVTRQGSGSIVAGKRVLVTGAGGSIGSELCRQIARFEPSELYLLDHDESNLHRLLMEIHGEALLHTDEVLIADIRDQPRIRQIFQEKEPQIVFHAAAHKHLPLLQTHPCEGVKSNVIGTRVLAEAAKEAGVERFILISTDKAADPTSVLGATKRLAEMIVRLQAGNGTRFASVRFGNVLGSRGSLLSVLSGQIENGEAFTVTHPEVTRFFMTIEEAVGLVIEAATMASVGETFVLDMGEPVRIVDLVRNYAAQMHLPEDAINIRFTGLRPGEKLSELLFGSDEERVDTAHPRIWATSSAPPDPEFIILLERLMEHANANRSELVHRDLVELLPHYSPPAGSADDVVFAGAPYPDGF